MDSMAETAKDPFSKGSESDRPKTNTASPTESRAITTLKIGSKMKEREMGRIQKLIRFITVISATTLNSIRALHAF